MSIVGLAELEPGMVLNSAVRSSQGRLLIPAGTIVTDKHIRMCKIWGVVEADVSGQAEAEHREEMELRRMAAEAPKASKEAKRDTRERFATAGLEHKAVKRLAKEFYRRLLPLVIESPGRSRPSLPPPGPGEDESPPNLKEVAARELELASPPDSFNRILRAINDPDSSAAYVAEVVQRDVSLSAKVLRAVNTPHYGFPRRIDTLTRAITLMGSRQILNLALGISVVSHFRDVPETLLNMHGFWQHSLACGIITRLLAVTCGVEDEERLFVAGLLHDIGKLVMLRNFQPQMARAMRLHLEEEIPLNKAEQRCWDFDHADVGGAVLDAWGLPSSLTSVIVDHHQPARDGMALPCVLVHLADLFAHAMQCGGSGAWHLPRFCAHCWDAYGLSSNLIPTIISQAETSFDESMNIFFP
ncbi:HDOD domain-containing protein [Desulfohalovibrio reitneri]|uniref:HDOD domain-containing protein n=1 Tax=Desulfohalovibrio reitneri TaxID=1307759 RepID=UPI0004A7757D|nr:HDOD domain-containing protein [Desulfohalovibrio reitneri]